MATPVMGKVLVQARIENLGDLYAVQQGLPSVHSMRTVDVPDALVDTGATSLSMPKRLIQELGLMPFRKRPVRTSAGTVELQVYGGVHLTVEGRDCLCDVTELPDECPVLIGQVPLELLDF